jgi:hypothetical protein
MKRYFYPLILALGFGGFAVAQELPSFDDVDTNGDGAISASEAAAVEGLDFTSADANQDGALSRAEYEAASQ